MCTRSRSSSPIMREAANHSKLELLDLKTPCNMIFSGSTTCGKTHLLKQLMTTQLIDKHDFTLVLATTANVSMDYSVFKESPNFQVRHKDIQERFEEVVNQQTELVESKGQDACSSILIILDDCLGDKSLQFGGVIDKFSVRSRHYKISIVILTQSLRRVPHTFRMNTRYMFAFSSTNFRELEAILEEFCPKKYKKSFTENLPEIFEVPYTFIFCQCFVSQPKDRLWAIVYGEDLKIKNVVKDIL